MNRFSSICYVHLLEPCKKNPGEKCLPLWLFHSKLKWVMTQLRALLRWWWIISLKTARALSPCRFKMAELRPSLLSCWLEMVRASIALGLAEAHILRYCVLLLNSIHWPLIVSALFFCSSLQGSVGWGGLPKEGVHSCERGYCTHRVDVAVE